MNIFLKIYNELWLTEENVGQEQLVENLTQSFEDSEQSKGAEEEGEPKPDPLTQLISTLSRKVARTGLNMLSLITRCPGHDRRADRGQIVHGVRVHFQSELRRR